ncbi:uroplakin-3a [Dendropsophus ebraccatus]|uniref:uroplakin-3a n=1 Tax=Dendropsophus ebraccatus TaxID=150705 RepID=UPI003831E32A
MGAWRCALVCVAVLLQYELAHAATPLLCSSSVCQINPSQTTIILEKPYCFATDATIAKVVLYVVQNSASDKTLALANTYFSTNGGSIRPYAAATFANPTCGETPSSVTTYTFRVGEASDCLTADFCNKALTSNTAYRFLYGFYDANNVLVTNSTWSAPISTRLGKASSVIDTWPGRRSGGMIVITSILSVLLFLVLAGLVAAVITYYMTPRKEVAPTIHESRSTHVPQKPEDTASGGGSERYAVNPQA